jgi:hypothetical protein
LAAKKGIKEVAMPPNLTISTRDNYSAETVDLSISAESAEFPLKSIEITVNGRLAGGRELQPANAGENLIIPEDSRLRIAGGVKKISVIIPLRLEAGLNLVEVAVSDGEAESTKRMYLDCSTAVPQKPQNLWILAIGINDYEYDNRDYKDLSCAVNDAELFVNTWKQQEGIHYNKIEALVISDNTLVPDMQTILNKLEYFKQNAGEDDTVIFYYSGHGEADAYRDFYVLPCDVEFVFLEEKYTPKFQQAISVGYIKNALDIPGRKLIFIDACKSGGVDNTRLARGLRNNSSVIFTSSRDNESSYEEASLGNGYFTHFAVLALKGASAVRDRVIIEFFAEYTARQVSEKSFGKQNPYAYIPSGYKGFVLAEYR